MPHSRSLCIIASVQLALIMLIPCGHSLILCPEKETNILENVHSATHSAIGVAHGLLLNSTVKRPRHILLTKVRISLGPGLIAVKSILRLLKVSMQNESGHKGYLHFFEEDVTRFGIQSSALSRRKPRLAS